MTFEDIIARIESDFSRLSPQLRRAAKYVIDHPDDMALYSMRQLAAHADVHPSTMVRLGRELGFDGHAEFQEPFQERLRSRPKVSYAGDARDLQERGGNGNAQALVADMFETERRSMKTLSQRVGVEAIAEAAEVLCGARNVFVVGSRSLYAVAHYFHYASRMFTHNVVLVDGLGGTFADQLRGIGEGDVVLATSFAPYSRDTVRAVEYALERGARIVSITDSAVSPLGQGKDTITLVAPNDSPSFFHSIVPAMAVAEALVMLMIARGGDGAMAQLAESEDQLNGFEAYWLEKSIKGRRR
ncbi:MurR/RpiR family transcriptional regulator [Pseudomonadota bacterium]